jgi:hypothetical protein
MSNIKGKKGTVILSANNEKSKKKRRTLGSKGE